MVNGNWRLICLILVISYFSQYVCASANAEGDALNTFRLNLIDPSGVLETWNTTDSPCFWHYVTCNSDNSVTRIDLGNASLSGQLVPELGQLSNLEYLELYNNNISGTIPDELGNLTILVSLDLYLNNVTGIIPNSLGKLTRLRYLRLHNNTLSGEIPMSLTTITTLQELDLSFNRLSGSIPLNGSFASFTPMSFIGNSNLVWSGRHPPHQIQTSLGSSPGNGSMQRIGWLISFSLAVLLKFGLATF